MNKNKLPSLVSILILTLITSIAWIGFNIYRALTIKPPEVVPEEISRPLNPKLDMDTLNIINSKLYFEDSDVPEISPTK